MTESSQAASRAGSSWSDRIEIVSSTIIPPDPQIMAAIGLNHSLETAVADLVDNSIDAGATNILIRFIRRGRELRSLCVVDDGHGLDDTRLAMAMAIGKRRDYEDTDLGHFGIGLKAASLGQADSLTVLSQETDGAPCGRRWLAEKARRGFECDVIDQKYVARMFSRRWADFGLQHGTIVRWDNIRSFPRTWRETTADHFIETTVGRLQAHLGLVFHRIIARRDINIVIDVEDTEIEEVGPPFRVVSVDPFGYNGSGRAKYPRGLPVTLDTGTIELNCHIWPPRSNMPGFKLQSKNVLEHQGFYFYRRDRLLQSGGWNGLSHLQRHLQLARIAVDVDGVLARHASMNPEKTAVDLDSVFSRAVEAARAGSLTFDSYLEDATEVFRNAQRRHRTRPKALPPGRGFPPPVRRAIRTGFDILAGEDPIAIRWTVFDGDDSFFEVDHDQKGHPAQSKIPRRGPRR